MENIKAYIESGVLELYVLGDLSPEESAQVEQMASQHPEVKQEIVAIEKAMEQYAVQNPVEPSAEVETKLFEKLGLKVDDVDTQATDVKSTAQEPKIVKLDPNHGKLRSLKFALVACVALLVMSTVALFSVYNQLNDAHDQIASLNTDKQKFAGVVSHLEFENKGLENVAAMADSKEWATIRMQGQAYSPKSSMKLYWNKTDKSVLINYVAMDLPKADAQHEYQLWALVNGKPVSLGMFGKQDSTSNEAILKMQTIDRAQAFAVTLEPMGGSTNPTMDKLTVMGGV
ncbi:anti-sigma factor [Pedobacter changchengzhani]|uniref:Anti-sigma factor n=1 Tax=Pedobacter changchengzhani TaxID=2529274 RepID=A0A4V2ZZV5_9SPHI|nr:anti-sigma factor [Pedobacter changchengzhani]TDG35173.1 anti-sigma factor [Pedobacter changchengzhani]